METNLNFLDDIDQYENPDSCDKSANGSTKSNSSGSENNIIKQKVMNT